MTLQVVLSWITAAVSFGTIIMFGSLGETLNEKAGGLNLGTPGIMMLGGFASLAGAFIYENCYDSLFAGIDKKTISNA